MRILLTVHQFMPRYNAGTEVATRDAALELLRRGHEVRVLTTEPERRAEASVLAARDYEHRGIEVHSITVPKRESKSAALTSEYRNPVVAQHVRDYLDAVDPDLVHVFHMAWLSGSILELFRQRGIPVVFTATDFWSICVRGILAKPSGELCQGPDDLSSNCLECRGAEQWFDAMALRGDSARTPATYRRLAEEAREKKPGEHRNMAAVRATIGRTAYLREQLNCVDAILAPTQVMRDKLTANGIREDLVRISPYGLELQAFRDARERRSRSHEVRFGFVGTIRRPKGVSILIDAFKEIPADAPANLRIVGDLRLVPDYGREVYARAEGDARINFTGLISNADIADQLENIDVLIVPSTWYENSPITIYSAFAAGVPAIASNLSGIAEVVKHEFNGLLFAPGDSQDLARQMRRVLDEPDLLETLRSNAREARRVEDFGDELETLYASLGANDDRHASAKPHEAKESSDSARRLENGSASAKPSPADVSIGESQSSAPIVTVATPRESVDMPSPIRVAMMTPGRPPDRSEPLFVTGRAKSGTTWITRLLNAHPDILCRGEGRFFGRNYEMGDSGVTSLYGALVNSSPLRRWFETSIWTRDGDVEAQLRDLTAVAVRRMLEVALRESGKQIVGDKTPLTGTTMIQEIAAIQPDAKVIHIIRDGRDVSISAMHHVWNRAKQDGGVHELSAEQLAKRDAYRRDPEGFTRAGESIFSEGWLAGTARDWKELVSRARTDGPAHLGDRYHELTYEELLEDPPGEFGAVLRFLGAANDHATIARCVERASFERLARGRRRGEEDPTHFLRKGISGEWRAVFTAEDREIFKCEAGDVLIQLGYEADLDW